MNKLQQFKKRILIEVAVAFTIFLGVAGVTFLVSGVADRALQRKTNAENALNQDVAAVSNARAQLEQSTAAEKRFVEVQLKRKNPDFTTDAEAIKTWLRESKTRYRLVNNFKLNLPVEEDSKLPTLANLEHKVKVRNGLTIEMAAMSDVHVFSFIEDFIAESPGLLRLDGVSLERSTDFTNGFFNQMLRGQTPALISAKLTFTWIGVPPLDKNAKPNPAAGAPMVGMP